MNKPTEFRPELTCRRCGHHDNDYTIAQRGNHRSCFCGRCGTWIKHLSHDNKYRTVEKREIAVRLTAGCCAYCGEILVDSFTLDHIHAQANGGGHDVDNLFAVCKSCNSRKGKKSLEQYRQYLSKIDGGTRIVFFFEKCADLNNLF